MSSDYNFDPEIGQAIRGPDYFLAAMKRPVQAHYTSTREGEARFGLDAAGVKIMMAP
jgi:hypothetical protein